MKKKQRGGFREGAGRHPLPPGEKKVQYRFYIEECYRDALKSDPDGAAALIRYVKRKYAKSK
jgi:hypothetical protein